MAYTTIDDPSAFFQTKLYTANGSDNRALTNDGNSDLKPDMLWIKTRNAAYNHSLWDSSRGVTLNMRTNHTNADITDNAGIKSFNTDGFTVGTSAYSNEGSSVTYAAWQWKANGGTTTSVSESQYNAGGTYQKNETAGFSVVSYTGIDTAGEVTHGLTTQPQVVIAKRRDVSGAWATYHESAGITGTLFLNETAAAANTTAYFHTGWGSATKFPIGTNSITNADGGNYIAYVFSERQGYSKFGSYIANANTNGPFVYTGFNPAFLMIKNTNRVEPWMMYDNKRTPINQIDTVLQADSAGAETTAAADYATDFLSNGFKIRAVGTGYANHTAGNKYIYMAFAENPFTTSTGIPTTAR